MNVLILSVSAGHGHNAAGEAIIEYIRQTDPDSRVLMVDMLKYISPVLDKVLVGTYINSLKIYPKAFEYISATFEKRTDSPALLMDKVFEKSVSPRLLPLIHEVRPDVIVCTHSHTAHAISTLVEQGLLQVPTLAIITDYASHSLWVHPGIDYYVVAHESMIPELAAAGRDPATVLPLGIPVRTGFRQTHDRAVTLAGIGLPDHLPTVTLMGGSLALGQMIPILEQLNAIPREFNIIVVTARNDKLYDEALELSLRSEKPIAVLRFCHFMAALMQATDLLITKPGGLTITEALSTGTPMAVFSPIGPHESRNKDFLMEHDLAIDLGSGEVCAGSIEDLLFHPTQLSEMARRVHAAVKPDSAGAICRQLKQMVDQAKANRVDDRSTN